MGETILHKYLKLLGIQYLDQQNCRLVATEIYVRKSASDHWLDGDTKIKKKADHYHQYLDGIESRLKEDNDSDSKWVIDVLGIGTKDILVPDEKWTHIIPHSKKKAGEETVIRGIEVKVSRADIKNGFCQTGLNYHYILCPELLVKKSEVPKHVGLLYWAGGKANTVYCAKRPRCMELNTDMLEYYRSRVYERYHSQIMGMTRDQLKMLSTSINGGT